MSDILDVSPLMSDVTNLGGEMLQKIRKRHIDAGQKATGKTIGSFHITPTGQGFQLVGWKYAGTYEEGRKPGSMPPPAALIEWARAKGITFDSDADAKRWAFALALKIKREGTKRYRLAQVGQQPDIFRTPIAEMQKQLESMVTDWYSKKIVQQIFRIDLNNK